MSTDLACEVFTGITYCCQTCGMPASDHEVAHDNSHAVRSHPCESFNVGSLGNPYCDSCGWIVGAHVPKPDEDGRDGLSLWWEGVVAIDIARTVPKLKEYGSRDLQAMGMALGQMREINLTPEQASIYGCMYYALGKCMRAIAALERGESPSEDTLFDLSIYSMMARAFHAEEL